MKLPGAVVGSMVHVPRDFQPWVEQEVLRCGDAGLTLLHVLLLPAAVHDAVCARES